MSLGVGFEVSEAHPGSVVSAYGPGCSAPPLVQCRACHHPLSHDVNGPSLWNSQPAPSQMLSFIRVAVIRCLHSSRTVAKVACYLLLGQTGYELVAVLLALLLSAGMIEILFFFFLFPPRQDLNCSRGWPGTVFVD